MRSKEDYLKNTLKEAWAVLIAWVKQNTKQDVLVPFELEASHGHEATEFSD